MFDRDSYNAGYIKALRAVYDYMNDIDEFKPYAFKDHAKRYVKKLIEITGDDGDDARIERRHEDHRRQ